MDDKRCSISYPVMPEASCQGPASPPDKESSTVPLSATAHTVYFMQKGHSCGTCLSRGAAEASADFLLGGEEP